MQSFHNSLNKIYANALERNRVKTYGENSQLRLLAIDPAQGNKLVIKQTLLHGWDLHNQFSGGDDAEAEKWAAEVHPDSGATPETMRVVSAIDLIANGTAMRFSVTQNNKPIEVGKVWNMKLEPTGERVEI